MKKLFKPAVLALCFLSLVVFFFVGIWYAGVTDAAKGQGLAGGAIVLFYGVIFAFSAFIVSFFVAFKVPHKNIVMINWVLTLLFVIFAAIFTFRFLIV